MAKMANTKLIVVHDPVADALDDLAALGQHWTRNRESGRMPKGIRAAMLLVARDVLALAGEEGLGVRVSQVVDFVDLVGVDSRGKVNK